MLESPDSVHASSETTAVTPVFSPVATSTVDPTSTEESERTYHRAMVAILMQADAWNGDSAHADVARVVLAAKRAAISFNQRFPTHIDSGSVDYGMEFILDAYESTLLQLEQCRATIRKLDTEISALKHEKAMS